VSVLSRSALAASPLADLHTLASELGLDGYRRLRKAALVDAIIERTGGDPAPDAEPAENGAGAVADVDADADADVPADDDDAPAPPRRARGGRGRSRRVRDADDGAEADAETADSADDDDEPKVSRGRSRRAPASREDAGESDAPRGRSRRGRSGEDAEETGPETQVEGVVELLGNGSGFLRVSPPEPSDDDVYISAAQVRRCELVSGDAVSGPMRPPRRSERYPSLVRVDTINGRPADEVAEGTHFDDLPAVFPTERFALDADDPTLKAIEWLTPVGRGSRVTIVGAPRAGKSEALRRLGVALKAIDGIELSVVLSGVRPEEIGEWAAAGVEPTATVALGGSADAQGQAIERCVETAKRIAARGGHAVVLIDGLDGAHPAIARKALAAARAIRDGGSLTVVAVSAAPLGGETTVIALDVALASTARFPALDLVASGTLRPELLVGDAGADAIASARAAALA
jgi:transcription termination factor Rho